MNVPTRRAVVKVSVSSKLAKQSALMALAVGALSLSAMAWAAPGMPIAPGTSSSVEGAAELKDVDIEERLGSQIPLDSVFTTSEGKKVKLGDLLLPGKPAILTLNYYECPMLCTLVLNGLAAGVKGLGFAPGLDYQIITISIAPTEEVAMAAEKKTNYLASVGRPIDANGWTFLLGDQANITKVAESAGFKYRYDKEVDQYAHGAGIFMLTPQGKVARVLYGIEYQPRDLRLALLEAGEGKLGSAIDKVLLYCFHYDPAGRKYAMVAMNVMRVGGIGFSFVLAIFVAMMFRNERRKKRLALSASPVRS